MLWKATICRNIDCIFKRQSFYLVSYAMDLYKRKKVERMMAIIIVMGQRLVECGSGGERYWGVSVGGKSGNFIVRVDFME